MATYQILETNNDYFHVTVSFEDQSFTQWIIVKPAPGQTQEEFIQAYADQYETDWLALPRE